VLFLGASNSVVDVCPKLVKAGFTSRNMAFDEYVSSVKGVHKLHFESIMSQCVQSLQNLEEQRRLEKEYVHEIASLKDS
jgi:hypothetical protein